MRFFFAILLAFALFAGACGSEPETVIIGAADDDVSADADVGEGTSDVADDAATVENVDEEPAVADDSAPTVEPVPCEIIGSGGPLDAAAVLIDAAGGRWGDDVMSVDSGQVENGISAEGTPSRDTCDVEVLTADCLEFFLFIGELADEFRSTARDDDRGHELDNYAGDVGADAERYVRVFEDWVRDCPTIDFDGDRAELVALDLGDTSAAELTHENQRVWIAVLARENVFTLLAVQQTDGDSLVEADLADFERLIELWRTRMENAPLS